MADLYKSPASLGVSYTFIPVTKSDVTVYDPPLRWLDIQTGGAVTIIDARGVSKTGTFPDGGSIKCLIKQVMSTGTDASGFIGYP